jgi:aryl-alcohol dehydrogenase-like predicted oxidoreductase
VSGTFRLGDDLEVHRLGFGAMRLAGGGVWGPPADREAARALLRRVVERGVDLIDTADSYGPDANEELIAEALHPYPDGLVIATKGGFTRSGPGRWAADCRPERLRECCEGSLRRLRLDRIDLYQLHTVDARVPVEESVGALAELQRDGKIRHVGLSNVSVEQLERARSVVEVVSVQNRYNLADRSSEDVLEVCERDGLGFLPWAPIAAGSLGGAPLGLRDVRRPVARQRARGVESVAREVGATTAAVALAWLLRRSPATLPIPGTSSVDHFEENMRALDVSLTDEQFAALAA